MKDLYLIKGIFFFLHPRVQQDHNPSFECLFKSIDIIPIRVIINN